MRTLTRSCLALASCLASVAVLVAACKQAEPTAGAAATATSATSLGTGALPRPRQDGNEIVYAIGDRAEAAAYAMTVKHVKECTVEHYFKPRKGNIKLGVEVLIEGTADKQIPVNPFYAKLTDSEGYSYTSTFAGCEPALKSVRVGRSEQAKGWITFELPKKASGLKLLYSPFVIGSGKQDLRFALGR